MYIQKNDFNGYFALYTNKDGEPGLFTYGLLRKFIGEEGLKKFEEKFDQYLHDERSNNKMVIFNVSEKEVDKVNEKLSNFDWLSA